MLLKEFLLQCRYGFLTELIIVLQFYAHSRISLKVSHHFSSQCYQLSEYNFAKADFGTELAISTRTELDPGKCIRLLNNVFR